VGDTRTIYLFRVPFLFAGANRLLEKSPVKKSICLACVARYGAVSVEENGVVRVRYGRMKLRFRPHEFALFAAEMRRRGQNTRGLEIRYNYGRMRLLPQELKRFAEMVQRGWSQVVDIQFARLTSGVMATEAGGRPGGLES
jgi:hypothetical protein